MHKFETKVAADRFYDSAQQCPVNRYTAFIRADVSGDLLRVDFDASRCYGTRDETRQLLESFVLEESGKVVN